MVFGLGGTLAKFRTRLLNMVGHADGLEIMLSHGPSLSISGELFLPFFGKKVLGRTRMQLVEILKRHNQKLVLMQDAGDVMYQHEDEE